MDVTYAMGFFFGKEMDQSLSSFNFESDKNHLQIELTGNFTDKNRKLPAGPEFPFFPWFQLLRS